MLLLFAILIIACSRPPQPPDERQTQPLSPLLLEGSAGLVGPRLPFSLEQNQPNPFNPKTTISFLVPDSTRITLEIFNVTGQRVTTLVDTTLGAGHYSYSWDATGRESGIYFYKVCSTEQCITKKMVLIK